MIDVKKLCSHVKNPPIALALRVDAILMLGLCVVHREKAFLYSKEAESYYLRAHKSVNISLSIDLPTKRKRRQDTDINIKNFEKNAKQRFEEWEAEDLDLEKLQRDLLKHVRQARLDEIDLSTIGNVTMIDDDISMIASRSFGQPSFGIETDVNAFVDDEEDEIKLAEEDAFSPPLPPSPVMMNDDDDKVRLSSLNAIRPPRVSSPSPSSGAPPPSLGGDETASQFTTNSATPIAPSKKRLRLCAIDQNTKLQFARPGPFAFASSRFGVIASGSESDDTNSTASSSFYNRKRKKRKFRSAVDSLMNLVIVGPSFLMGGAAPALMDMWKRRTSVPQIEKLRAGSVGSRRSSVLDFSEDDDVSRKLDFEDDNNGMAPLDSPPPSFEDQDDFSPANDEFSSFNRASSIGRFSEIPPTFEIDRTKTKERGLNDASLQMFRLLVRSGLVDENSKTSLSEMIEPFVSHDAVMDHRHFRLSNGPCRSSKHFAASAFAQLLVLKSRDVVNVSQLNSMGEIIVSAGPHFGEVSTMVSAF